MLMKAGANKSERPRDAGATPLQMAETGWLMVASDAFDQGFRKYAACSYPLVNVYITMENQHFLCENSL